jgi:SAM-dependent methyltransferase
MSRYGKLCTIVYDLDKPLATPAETTVYTQFAAAKTDAILEPMCGSGRFLVPLAQQGYNVTGFDISEHMLAACRRRCAALGLSPILFQADVTGFQAPDRYQCVFIPFGSLSLLLSDTDFLAALAQIRGSLKEKGVFVFAFLGPDTNMEETADWEETINYPLGDARIVCLQRAAFRKRDAVWDIKLRYEIRRGGEVLETEDQDFPVKLRDDDFVTGALERTGFTDIGTPAGVPSSCRFHVLKGGAV